MNLNVSIDGLRKNLVNAFNEFANKELLKKLDDEDKDRLAEIIMFIGALNCVYLEDKIILNGFFRITGLSSKVKVFETKEQCFDYAIKEVM